MAGMQLEENSAPMASHCSDPVPETCSAMAVAPGRDPKTTAMPMGMGAGGHPNMVLTHLAESWAQMAGQSTDTETTAGQGERDPRTPTTMTPTAGDPRSTAEMPLAENLVLTEDPCPGIRLRMLQERDPELETMIPLPAAAEATADLDPEMALEGAGPIPETREASMQIPTAGEDLSLVPTECHSIGLERMESWDPTADPSAEVGLRTSSALTAGPSWAGLIPRTDSAPMADRSEGLAPRTSLARMGDLLAGVTPSMETLC